MWIIVFLLSVESTKWEHLILYIFFFISIWSMCAFFTYLKIPTQQNNECNIDQMEISDVCVPSCVSENHPDFFFFFHFMSKIGMMIKVWFHTNFFATKAIGRKNVVYHILLVMMANFHPKMLKIKTMIIFVFSENDYYRTILCLLLWN